MGGRSEEATWMTETIRSHFPEGTEEQLQTVGSNVTEHGDKNPCQREGILNEGETLGLVQELH